MTLFKSTLINPSEFHAAYTSQSQNTRIIPIAAGRPVHLPSFEKQHVPGSVFFNMDAIKTPSPYPQMLPSSETFAAAMRDLGIRPSDILVVYDAVDVGTYNAPRVAWTCRLFGHESVHVLNNFRIYSSLYPTSSGAFADYGVSDYPLRELDATQVIDFDEIKDTLLSEANKYQILDARIPGRFAGTQSELDPTLRSGHIPGSINIPLAALLDPESEVFLSLPDLQRLFDSAGVTTEKPVILTCNSGVTAAALHLALTETGLNMDKRVYDGSWMEWTRRADDSLVHKNSI